MPTPSKIYGNKLRHYQKKLTKSTNVTRWLDMRLKAMSKLLLGLIFNRESKNHNEFESLSLLLHSLVHPNDPITLT
jgi:hypothetical protein